MIRRVQWTLGSGLVRLDTDRMRIFWIRAAIQWIHASWQTVRLPKARGSKRLWDAALSASRPRNSQGLDRYRCVLRVRPADGARRDSDLSDSGSSTKRSYACANHVWTKAYQNGPGLLLGVIQAYKIVLT